MALLDELVKIAEEQSGPGKALRAMAVGAGGLAAGYGLSEIAARNMKFFQSPNEGKARAAKIILPILTGASVMLADRYRQKMNEEFGKVKGYDAK